MGYARPVDMPTTDDDRPVDPELEVPEPSLPPDPEAPEADALEQSMEVPPDDDLV